MNLSVHDSNKAHPHPTTGHNHMLLWPGGLTTPFAYLDGAQLSPKALGEGHSFIFQPYMDQHSANCRAMVMDTTVVGEALTPLPVLGQKKWLEMPV